MPGESQMTAGFQDEELFQVIATDSVTSAEGKHLHRAPLGPQTSVQTVSCFVLPFTPREAKPPTHEVAGSTQLCLGGQGAPLGLSGRSRRNPFPHL